MSKPNATMPLLVSAGLIVAGLLIGVIGGLGSGSLAGGLIAVTAVVPSAYAAWLGVQQETQGTLLAAILSLLASLAVGGLLIILWLVAKVF